MDDFKLYATNSDQLDYFVNAVKIAPRISGCHLDLKSVLYWKKGGSHKKKTTDGEFMKEVDSSAYE